MIPTSFILFFVLCLSHALPIYLGRISSEGVERYHLHAPIAVLAESSQWWVFLLYRIIIFVVLLLVSCLGTNKKLVQSFVNSIDRKFIPTEHLSRAVAICRLIFLLIPLCVLLSPDPITYFKVYGSVELRALTSAQPDIFHERHLIISKICLFGIFIFSVIYWFEIKKTKSNFSPRIIFAFFLAGLLAFLVGKRSTIFIVYAVIMLFSYYETRTGRFFYIVLTASLIIFVMIYPYFGKSGVTVSMENTQNTFFRDNIVVPCIANSHLTSNDMMNRGNGIIFCVSQYVPRKFWPEKPYATPHYVTRYILGGSMTPDDELIGWNYGVGFIEEGLVNFGYLGVLAYTALVILLCRFIDFHVIRYGTVMCLLQGPLAYFCLFSLHIFLRIFVVCGLPLLFFFKFFHMKDNTRHFPMEYL